MVSAKDDYARRSGVTDHLSIAKPREEITISLPNGKEEKGTSWETTPASIAKAISKSLLERTVISMVDGELWDLTRPLEKSCKLELIDFENIEGMPAHRLGPPPWSRDLVSFYYD